MSNDINWCIRHPEEAVEYFKERQTSHLKLINDLASRKDKSEFDGMYREMKELNEQFNKYYSDVIVASSDLVEMEDKFKKGEIFEERYDLQKSKIKNKLVESFQELIEIDTRIEGVRKDIVTVEQEIKTVSKEREGSGEKLKRIEKEPNNSQESRYEKKYGMKAEIFLSYARSDRERAKIFAETLVKQGYSVWWDRNIPHGRKFDEYILEKLNQAKCVIVLWSKDSVKSDWVKDEAERGKRREILVPVLIDDVDIPLGFGRYQTAQLFNWRGTLPNEEFELLSKSIAEILGQRQAEETEIQKPGEQGVKREIKKEKPIPNSIGMKFTFIPEGEFMMGSEENDNEKPVHKVTISKPFYLGIYPVTQREWKAVMENNPSNFKGDDLPVEKVSWNDVQKFIKKLNEKEGTNKYRLPSEAEWEYAARADLETRYSFGDNESKLGEYAWYDENSDRKTHPVGEKKPNPWGLYDMHGNVCEWVQDRWHSKYHGAPIDGSGWEEDDSVRVNRGGSWSNFARRCRSASRHSNSPVARDADLGFRLLKEI